MLRAVVLAFALSFTAPALAAGLAELRAEATGATARLERARAERVALEKALAEVAARIETLKARRSSGGSLFGDGDLDALLKRSQGLSGELNQAQRAEREAAQALLSSQDQLAKELDRSIDALYGRWDSMPLRAERQALIPQIRSLRGERDALRRGLPAAAVPRFDSRAASDDGEELLEHADALLDSVDKLRREEQALTRRIQQLERERALQRRMDEFLSESALFDEHDRRLVVSRGAPPSTPSRSESGSPAASNSGTVPSGPGVNAATEGASKDFGGGNSTVTEIGGSVVPSRDSQPPAHSGGLEPLAPANATVGVARMPPERRSGAVASLEDASLEELTARRARIHALAQELQRRAEDVARRAREHP